ncbi:dienelactone hydrolase family protein [Xanthobacter autotrophicus]|uniref:dienelactone hydrolase family protein n=1 Tax=Xanthobacter autotrophicus TaxID=280 RepID=UPI0024A6F9A2|nr:dienelactone hydrolase family protein [Xanthobacter autotrophicus]MDI4655317.1 dienelactone hydrolase family protein [Xanthobacter autotrophicus]
MGAYHEYHGGGTRARGYYAAPQNGAAQGGVLVIHEAPGLGAHVQRRVDALAASGYAALAADLHGEGRLARNFDEAIGWVRSLKADPDMLLSRLNSALDTLSTRSGIGKDQLNAAGYCFGGWCGLELARAGAPLRSVSVFHGSVKSDRSAAAIKGSVLICTGDCDPFAPLDQLIALGDEMRAARVDYQLCLYGGVEHGFTNPDVPAMPGYSYSAAADRRSWASLLNLLSDSSPRLADGVTE